MFLLLKLCNKKSAWKAETYVVIFLSKCNKLLLIHPSCFEFSKIQGQAGKLSMVLHKNKIRQS